MPGASETERRAATDRQLHETVTARAWAQASEWEQYRARKAEAKAARAEAAAAQPQDDAPAASLAPVVLLAPRPAAAAPALEPETADVDDDQELVLEDLTPDQVRDWRVRAMKDHQVVFDHIDRYGEPSAHRLFSNRLVDQAQHISGLGHLNVGYFPWGQSWAAAKCPVSTWHARPCSRPGKNGATRQKPKRRTTTVVRRNGREPLGLGNAISRMMTEPGMAAPAADGVVDDEPARISRPTRATVPSGCRDRGGLAAPGPRFAILGHNTFENGFQLRGGGRTVGPHAVNAAA
ncbi:hypothetical protein AB0D56_37270 [Streptomyces sp. NPDC048209]|uniref:hypothetical protein n=1 Tax=Streptomyces sp. NPDC048209 TaxID=3156689 RepID=UPI00342D87EF